jgi:hypothetical protein
LFLLACFSSPLLSLCLWYFFNSLLKLRVQILSMWRIIFTLFIRMLRLK